MTVLECYNMIGADYSDVLARFQKESLIERFFLKYENDKSFNNLMAACEANNRDEAFNAAHSLKGVAGNLALTGLATAACELTEQLRSRENDPDPEIVTRVIIEHRKVMSALMEFKAGA